MLESVEENNNNNNLNLNPIQLQSERGRERDLKKTEKKKRRAILGFEISDPLGYNIYIYTHLQYRFGKKVYKGVIKAMNYM